MSAQRDPDCLFCKIVAGDIPADVVHETDTVIAFRDISPAMPVHVLVIPRDHHRNAVDLADADPAVAADMLRAARVVAERENLTSGYRLVLNTDADAGQAVFHVHLHVLGGRPMSWPPG